MPKVDEMFAFVVADTNPEDEGILGFQMPGSDTFMPMVGADLTRVHALIPMADKISKAMGVEYKILKFELIGELKEEELNAYNNFSNN